ncbi:DUF6414 family protein [Mammaliicoccus sciuri]|uniref:DUF6414 family protein n=1 Tax=Mammaliicoccus sciuri TaxID=1296 RepID=UPI001FB21EF8|nr:DUF6414 family protein [Mammaliicoccus sciuri]MCJ0943932.1 DUF6414 family protein [Mammaliicoccus sciuri]
MSELIKKVIYFDELSAMDLLQIEKKGNLTKTVQLINREKGEGDAEASLGLDLGKQSALKQLFETMLGISGEAKIKGGVKGSVTGDRIGKTILENALIYDFLDTVEFRKKKYIIDISEGFQLSIPRETMTYFATISPVATMFNGLQHVENEEELSIDISKVNDAIRNIKGYFELEGIRKKEKRIFRFNIDAFKNNYRIQDLKFMNLKLYSIYVGKIDKNNLSFQNEFDLNDSKQSGIGNFSGFTKNQNEENIYEVYDVILAGVK